MEERELDDLHERMFYETSCKPKRKDHQQTQIDWCRKIDEITPDKNYFEFYKTKDIRLGYLVICKVHNWDFNGHIRTYTSRKSSSIKALMDIYKQIRDLL